MPCDRAVLANVLCLDFEASAVGPRSYPIEVAVIACETGSGKDWLIRPPPCWLEHGSWSAESAGVHGIALRSLIEDGIAAEQVARELAELCREKTVLCDGGEHDLRWLVTLFSAIEEFPPFELTDFHAFAWNLALQSGCRPDVAIVRSENEAHARFPVTHRAQEDARHLAEMLRLIAGWP